MTSYAFVAFASISGTGFVLIFPFDHFKRYNNCSPSSIISRTSAFGTYGLRSNTILSPTSKYAFTCEFTILLYTNSLHKGFLIVSK